MLVLLLLTVTQNGHVLFCIQLGVQFVDFVLEQLVGFFQYANMDDLIDHVLSFTVIRHLLGAGHWIYTMI